MSEDEKVNRSDMILSIRSRLYARDAAPPSTNLIFLKIFTPLSSRPLQLPNKS